MRTSQVSYNIPFSNTMFSSIEVMIAGRLLYESRIKRASALLTVCLSVNRIHFTATNHVIVLTEDITYSNRGRVLLHRLDGRLRRYV